MCSTNIISTKEEWRMKDVHKFSGYQHDHNQVQVSIAMDGWYYNYFCQNFFTEKTTYISQGSSIVSFFAMFLVRAWYIVLPVCVYMEVLEILKRFLKVPSNDKYQVLVTSCQPDKRQINWSLPRRCFLAFMGPKHIQTKSMSKSGCFKIDNQYQLCNYWVVF